MDSMKKFLKKLLLPLLVLPLLLVAGCGQQAATVPKGQSELVGTNYPDMRWVTIQDFVGFQTKPDPSKVSDGANPNGQNTTINDGDRISVRPFGSTIFGQSTTTAEAIQSLHTFRRRSGENIMQRSHGTVMEYYESGNSTWENLANGFATSGVFAYTDYNINTDQRSYVYFGNAVDSMYRWTGAHTLTSGSVSAGGTSIPAVNTTDFTATGTVHYCGQDVLYTSKTLTAFAVSTTIACDASRGIAQTIQAVPSMPRGNILLNTGNRIFVAGITSTPQAVYFSRYGDPTDYVGANLITSSTADAPGIFNLAEGGGAVTGFSLDEGALYIFKKSIIYKAVLTDAIYSLTPLKPFDGKSQTTGSDNSRTVFTGGNGTYFVTPDRQIMNLQRIEYIDYPQMSLISDIIKPTVDSLVFTSSTGITFRDKAYFAVKTDANSLVNDVVLPYNQKLKVWESPIVGWTVSDWTVYNDGTGDALYYGDAANANVFKVTDGSTDNDLGITANWRSKIFDFEKPEVQKEIDNFYVEGYISNNTTLSVSLLIDEGGVTQTYTASFRGTETDYLFNANPFNLFGFHPFGFERFGSGAQSDAKQFRVYFNKNLRLIPFYSAQVEFASDGESQDWQITQFGFHIRESSQPERRTLYRAFQ